MTTWSPVRDLENIRGSLLGILGRHVPPDGRGCYSTYEWAPLVDVAEDDNEYTVVADLPAIRRENIHVTLSDGSLELSGERTPADGNLAYHKTERGHGKFGRTFYLPDDADPERMKAEYKDGALTVHIPLRPRMRGSPGGRLPSSKRAGPWEAHPWNCDGGGAWMKWIDSAYSFTVLLSNFPQLRLGDPKKLPSSSRP